MLGIFIVYVYFLCMYIEVVLVEVLVKIESQSKMEREDMIDFRLELVVLRMNRLRYIVQCMLG